MTIRALFPTLCWLTLAGCGDGSGEGNDSPSQGTCSLRADVAGGTAIQFTGKDDAACATQHSFDTGLDAAFIGTNAKGTLELVIDDVAEGEVGNDYPTRIVVTSPDGVRWQGGDCLASISEHRLLEVVNSEIGELRQYLVSGDGSCTTPLESELTHADAVTLGPFAFRAGFTWRD